jgi:hypothetical protein
MSLRRHAKLNLIPIHQQLLIEGIPRPRMVKQFQDSWFKFKFKLFYFVKSMHIYIY